MQLFCAICLNARKHPSSRDDDQTHHRYPSISDSLVGLRELQLLQQLPAALRLGAVSLRQPQNGAAKQRKRDAGDCGEGALWAQSRYFYCFSKSLITPPYFIRA